MGGSQGLILVYLSWRWCAQHGWNLFISRKVWCNQLILGTLPPLAVWNVFCFHPMWYYDLKLTFISTKRVRPPSNFLFDITFKGSVSHFPPPFSRWPHWYCLQLRLVFDAPRRSRGCGHPHVPTSSPKNPPRYGEFWAIHWYGTNMDGWVAKKIGVISFKSGACHSATEETAETYMET